MLSFIIRLKFLRFLILVLVIVNSIYFFLGLFSKILNMQSQKITKSYITSKYLEYKRNACIFSVKGMRKVTKGNKEKSVR